MKERSAFFTVEAVAVEFVEGAIALVRAEAFADARHEGAVHLFIHLYVIFEDAAAQLAGVANILKLCGAFFQGSATVSAVAEFIGAGVAGAVVVPIVLLQETGSVLGEDAQVTIDRRFNIALALITVGAGPSLLEFLKQPVFLVIIIGIPGREEHIVCLWGRNGCVIDGCDGRVGGCSDGTPGEEGSGYLDKHGDNCGW